MNNAYRYYGGSNSSDIALNCCIGIFLLSCSFCFLASAYNGAQTVYVLNVNFLMNEKGKIIINIQSMVLFNHMYQITLAGDVPILARVNV